MSTKNKSLQWEPFIEVTQTELEGKELAPGQKLYSNNLYNVLVIPLEQNVKRPEMVWLVVTRKDHKHVRDSKHLQRIKNELVGPECEGMEMFPAESRKIQPTKQIHLFVITDPTIQWNWGYDEGLISATEEAIQPSDQ